MSKVAFANNYKSVETGHVILPSISFRSYDEFQKLNNWDKQDLIMLMQEREAEKAAERTINSNQIDRAVEEAIGRIIQENLNNR